MRVGYVRVSTAEQNTARQEVIMETLKVEKIFILNAISPFVICFPYRRSPLKGNPRRLRSRGTHSALAS